MLFTPQWLICRLHHDDWYVVNTVMIDILFTPWWLICCLHHDGQYDPWQTFQLSWFDCETSSMRHLPPSPGMKHLPPSPGMRHLPPVPWYEHLPLSPGMKHLPFFPKIPKFAGDWSWKVCHNGQYNAYTMATNIMLFINWATCYCMRRESGHVQLHVWTLNLEGHIHILVNKEATYRVVSPLSPRKLKRVTPVKRLLFKNLHRVRINFGGYI